MLSKIKEAIICFLAGIRTLKYPFAPHDPAPEFRGYPEVDVNRCFGCGACAAACPARVMCIEDVDQHTRRITRLRERCIYCGRCADVCPQKAITMTKRFELASDNARQDMEHVCEVFMATCQRCGRCYHPATPLDRIMQPGYRHDEIKRGGEDHLYEPVGAKHE